MVNDGRKRVLFLNTTRQPSLGADTWIHLQIMRELDRSNVEVHAGCAPGKPRRPTPTYRWLRELPDTRLVKVDLGSELSGTSRMGKALAMLSVVPSAGNLLRLAWYVRRHRIELIHTSDRPRDAAASVFLARVTRAKCIVHVHVGFDPGWMRAIQQRAIRRADALIAISDFVATTLRDGGCDPRRIHVVLNGVELARWTPGLGRDDIRNELAIGETTLVVLTVCRLFRDKGVTDLVEAMHDLRDEFPASVLLVVGQEMEAGYLDELRARVSSYALSDRVRFLGHRDDIPAVMAAADVFAMPSEREPFGLVYAEAMAMALPVVARDNGGTVEVVEQGVTGLLSARGDRAALAANLGAVLRDPSLRATFGLNGRRRVEQLFTTGEMAHNTAVVFARVLGGPEAATTPSGSVKREAAASGVPTGVGMQGTLGLTANEFAEALERVGYVVIRDVVSQDNLATFSDDLLATFDRLVEGGLPFKGGGLLSGHLNCFPGAESRFIYDELHERGVIDLVRAYRPEIVDAVRPTLNLNLPGSVAQHYHIDDAYLKEFLICNVAVVDTDLVNGAIDVLPGTNREYYKFWRYALERKYRLTTRVPLQRGDVIVRKSTLWHRGMPNRSLRPRPMMAITFGEIDDPAADPFLVNGGEIEFYPNWFNTSRLGRLREQAFVHAPITYSAYRFVTSLYGNKGYESY